MTPPLRIEVDRSSQSAQHSLDFARSQPNSDPVPVTSDTPRLSSHSCPDKSSYLEMSTSWQPRLARTCGDVGRSRRQSAGSVSIKTALDERVQSSSSVTPPRHSLPSAMHTGNCCDGDQLDRTLTGADVCTDVVVTDEAAAAAVDESSQSRWSTSDYFHRYPTARRDCTAYPECNVQRFRDASHTVIETDNRQTGIADADDSTLISSIHQNGSPAARRLSACLSPSVEGSVETSSSSLDTVSTSDDTAFRAGLAKLDANIARVQRRLRASLSSPTSPCRTTPTNSNRHD